MKPLSETEISDILEAEHHTYPSRVPLCEINFRNSKCFEQFRSSGIAFEAEEAF
jgi:hypothetical protein